MGKLVIKPFVWIFLFFALLFTSSSIENENIYSMNALYIVNPNNTVNEYLNYTFSLAVNKSILYPVDKNISNLIVSDGKNLLNYSIIDNEKNYLINITSNDTLTKLMVSYTSINDIFQKDSILFFFKDYNFNNPINKIDVTLVLPLGYSVYNSEYSPKEAIVSSDGGNILLKWTSSNVIKSISYSARFYNPSLPQIENNSSIDENVTEKTAEKIIENYLKKIFQKILPFIFGIPFILLFIALISLLVFVKRLRKKANDHLLKGFMDDERKVILYMQKNKHAWQNNIRKEFTFSRAKTTRIIKKLEERGLVKKEEFGKTNKIHWVKKS